MAGIAGVTHHIELDGKGYIIKDGTYRKANQAPLIQRIGIGESELTSVSAFQYVRQDDFTGGKDQRTHGDPYDDRYWDSRGFYPKDVEELRLQRATQVAYSLAINESWLIPFSNWLWLADKTTRSLRYSTSGTSWSTFTFPTGYPTGSSGAIAGMAVVHNKLGEPRLLIMSATGVFFAIKPTGTVDTDVGDVNGVRDYSAYGGTWSCLIEWGNAIYFGRNSAVFRRTAMEDSEVVADGAWMTTWWYTRKVLRSAYVALMGDDAFTPPEDYFDRFPAGTGVVTCMMPALSPQVLCVGTYDSDTENSYITISNGITEFPTEHGDFLVFQPGLELADFEIRSMAAFQNALIYGGRKEINGRDVGHVYGYPRELLAEVGDDLTDSFDYTVRAMASHDDVLFGFNNNVQTGGNHAPGVMNLSAKGHVPRLQAPSFASGSSTIVDAIATFKGQVYWAVRGVGLYRTHTTTDLITSARLETSEYDGHLKMVEKKWLDCKIELGQLLSGDQQIVVKARSSDGERYITQPVSISGVSVSSVANATGTGNKTLTYTYSADPLTQTLTFGAGSPVDVSAGGYFTLADGAGGIVVYVDASILPAETINETLVVGSLPITLLTMTAADGYEKKGYLPDNVVCPWLKVTVEFSQSSADADIVIKSLLLRFLPMGDTKKTWGFVIRAYDDIELLDSTPESENMETRTGFEIFQEILTVYNKRQPIVLEDIENELHKVILSNIQAEAPQIQQPSPQTLEYEIAVELTEV